MGSRKDAGRKPAGKKRGGKKRASRLLLIIAAAVPLLMIGGYMLYHTDNAWSRHVVSGGEKARQVLGGLKEKLRSLAPGSGDRLDLPQDRSPVPAAGPAGREKTARPRAITREPTPIPRQRPQPAATAEVVQITVRQAQRLARSLFQGRVATSSASPHSFWYSFTLDGARRRYPFDAVPGAVSISTVGLTGTFLKGQAGMVVFVKAEDSGGAQWTSSYVGATFFAGTPEQPGKLLGATAIQAPLGAVTRHEALDIEGDGVLELALEIESQGPGGYLFRDFALHSFTSGGTMVRWNTRTLEDGPGVPLDRATFRKVRFEDQDGDGTMEIVAQSGERRYAVNRDFTRTLKSERTLKTRVYRSLKGRFRLAKK